MLSLYKSHLFYCVGLRPEATKVTIDQRGSLEMFHKENLPEAYFNMCLERIVNVSLLYFPQIHLTIQRNLYTFILGIFIVLMYQPSIKSVLY